MSKFMAGVGGGVIPADPVKKSIFWVITSILIVIVLGIGIYKWNHRTKRTHTGFTTVEKKSSALSETLGESGNLELSPWICITLTTEFSPWVMVEEGLQLDYFMLTYRLYWDVIVHYKGTPEDAYVIFQQNPIQTPQSGFLNLEGAIDRICWRIVPPATPTVETLTGKLKYRFVELPSPPTYRARRPVRYVSPVPR